MRFNCFQLLWLLVLFPGGLFAQEKPDLSLKWLYLTGPVYTVRTETVVEGSPPKPTGNREFVNEHTFDKFGNLIATQYPGDDTTGLFETKWRYQFDQQQRIIRSDISVGPLGQPPKRFHTEVYTYDEKGRNTIVKNLYSTGQEYTRTTYLYDQAGKLVEKRFTSSDKVKFHVSYFARIQYLYDDKQHLMAKRCFGTQDQLLQYETYRDNERPGLEWPYEMFDKEGQLLIRWDYRYDDRGRPVELYHYGRGGVMIKHSTMSYEDDTRGNWIRLKIVREVNENDTTKTEYETQLRTIKYY